MFRRLGFRRYSPASYRSVEHLRTQLVALRDAVKRLEQQQRERLEQQQRERSKVDDAITTLQRQSQEILKELRTANETLEVLTRRESQLRAILRRDGELETKMPRLEKTIRRSGIDAHVKRAIGAAELRLDPFPYIVVDNLLPSDLYEALLRGLPPVELFADKPVNKQHIGVPFLVGPAYGRRVWRFMSDVVIHEFLTPVVLEKFRAPVQAWVAESWPELDLAAVELASSDGRIMLRRRGYVIPPHRDPKWGFITGLMYLKRPEDSEAWGTQLYAVDADEEAHGDAPYWIDPRRCRQMADVAYKANRLLIFLNSAGAHGASIPEDAPASVERYLYQFRIGPTLASMGKLKALLPPDRQRLWTESAHHY